MLWFEREVVGALIESPDQPLRSAVESFVDGSLRDMPEHLRSEEHTSELQSPA